MKTFSKILLRLLVTVLFAFSIFVVESNAQCVLCTPAPPGWICTGTKGVGGQACLPEGEECRLIGTCSPEPDFDGRDDHCSPKVLKYSLVSVSDNIIREINEFNPRVAAVLINVRDIRVEFTVGKINFAPIELTAEDVLKRLTSPKFSEYFEERQDKVRRAFAVKQEPIIYEFVLNKNGRNSSLLIRALSVGESQSSFEINLAEIYTGRGKNTSVRFEATSWKMN